MRKIFKLTASPTPGDDRITVYYSINGSDHFKVEWNGEQFYNDFHGEIPIPNPDFQTEMTEKIKEFLVRE